MPRRPRSGTRILIVAITAIVIVALWALALVRMEVDRRSTIAAVERENDNLALTLGEENSRALRDVDERLRALARHVAEKGALDETALAGFDRRMVTLVIATDAQGRVTSTTGSAANASIVSDRDYFVFQRDHRTTGPYVGRRTLGRVSREVIIPVSVRVETPDGRFSGVVVAALKPSYFDALYSKPQLGDEGVVFLIGTDGFVRASRRPDPYEAADLRDSTVLRLQRSRPAGHFLTKGMYGVPRFLSYYTLPEYPSLVVAVGRARDEALAEYRNRTLIVVEVTAITTAVVLSLAALIAMFHRRQREHLEAMRASEARYRQAAAELGRVVDGSVDMICSFDKDGRYAHVSAGSELVLGYTPDELVGRQGFDLVHPDDLERTREAFQAVLAGRPVRAFENRTWCRDGTFAHTMWSARWIQSEQTMFCVARDVTEKKLLEAANRALESRLGETLEMLAAGFCILDASWRVTYVNRAAEAIRRVSREESLGRSLWEVVTELVGSVFEREYRRAMRERTPGRVCAHFPSYDGWFEVRTYPGTDGGIVLYIDDVTGREEALQRLAESEQRFEHVALATSDAIWDWTYGSDHIWWSEGIEALFGHDPHGPASTIEGWKALIHPEDRERVLASIREALAQATSKWSGEYRLRRADGTYATVRDYASIMRGPDGPARMIGALSDITERHELERQLMRTQRLESVGTLASGIAHDLNNVFTPIVMGLNLVGTEHLDSDQRAILDTVRASAQRGAQLVKQVLSFARGQSGHRVPLQPAEIMREVERMMRETFPRNIAISVHASEDLPAVMGDATQLHQVLLNLCLNARDAMPRGGKLEVRADVVTLAGPMRSVAGDLPAGPYVRIEVSDDGVGMDEAVIERLFEPFFTTKPVGSGTGLGLPTALSIVGKHGGGMQVRSEMGHGSSFTVWLPASEGVRGNPRDEPNRRAARGAGQRILVVDDEAAVRDMACRALVAAGYHVESAADGAQALELLRKRRRDVLFTDLMMPGMDGASLVREALRIDPALRVVCASGIAADAATLPHGAVFLPKPYSTDALACAVGDVLLQTQPA